MTDSKNIVELRDTTGALAVLRPDLGGWLLRYARPLPGRGLVEALHYDPAVVARYPKEMWAGNPILFPHVSFNVAREIDGQYELDGTLYQSPQHGFGRRVPWMIVEQSSASVTLELREGPDTLPSYPFRFRHRLKYTLVKGRLELYQTVENLDLRPLPFSTGIHPYFRVPLAPDGERSQCFVRLPRCLRYNPIGQCESFFTEPVAAQDWPVSRDVSGTVFLGDFTEPEMALVDPSAGVQVVVNFSGAPAYRYAALWSRTTDAPFYCIEPWTALPNSFGRSNGELIILPSGDQFSARIGFDIQLDTLVTTDRSNHYRVNRTLS